MFRVCLHRHILVVSFGALSCLSFSQNILDIFSLSMDAVIELLGFSNMSSHVRENGPRTLYSSTASSQDRTSAESSQISACDSGFEFFPMVSTIIIVRVWLEMDEAEIAEIRGASHRLPPSLTEKSQPSSASEQSRSSPKSNMAPDKKDNKRKGMYLKTVALSKCPIDLLAQLRPQPPTSRPRSPRRSNPNPANLPRMRPSLFSRTRKSVPGPQRKRLRRRSWPMASPLDKSSLAGVLPTS